MRLLILALAKMNWVHCIKKRWIWEGITFDLRKELKTLYQPAAKAVQVVDVPRFKILMIDGENRKRPSDSEREGER